MSIYVERHPGLTQIIEGCPGNVKKLFENVIRGYENRRVALYVCNGKHFYTLEYMKYMSGRDYEKWGFEILLPIESISIKENEKQLYKYLESDDE